MENISSVQVDVGGGIDWSYCVQLASHGSWSQAWARLLDESCHWLALSKALSCAVIAGAAVGKLPQAVKIWRAKSALGVSALAVWLEVGATGVNVAYNVARRTPWSTFGEAFLLFGQLHLLIVVIACFESSAARRICGAGVSAGVMACTLSMASRSVPVLVTNVLYAFSPIFGIAVSLPQLLLNYRRRSTGQLSFVVAAMGFGGCSTRLFTTLFEIDDVAIRAVAVMNWALSSLAIAQFIAYWNSDARTKVDVAEACESDGEICGGELAGDEPPGLVEHAEERVTPSRRRSPASSAEDEEEAAEQRELTAAES